MKIKIDNREEELIKNINFLIANIPSFKDIQVIIETLPLGDIIIYDEESDKLVIERKSVNDLLSSIKDGRYEEQSYRLNGLNHHNHNIIYLIEGDINRLNNRFKDNKIEKLTLYSAILSLNYFKGFSVIRTFSLEETAIFICNTVNKLKKGEIEKKNPYYGNAKIEEHIKEVIDSSNVEGNRYAVGTEEEMKSSCYDNIENLIDDIGYKGFNDGFAQGYIDEEEVIRYAEDLFEDDVRENPESYMDEDDRLLSTDQEEKIEQFRIKISQAESMIERFESEMDGENDDDLQERIDEMNERIEEMNDEITEIEEDPDGDYPEDKIEDAIENRVNDVKYDVMGFMEDFGLNWDDYINKDDFIEGVIDADGYGHTLNSYDGNADETKVQDQWFYVMRLD